MLTSAVQVGQRRFAASDRTIDLDNRVVVGEDVGIVPASASGSAKPRTINRAFARGVPSSFFDHLSKMREVKVRASSASAVV